MPPVPLLDHVETVEVLGDVPDSLVDLIPDARILLNLIEEPLQDSRIRPYVVDFLQLRLKSCEFARWKRRSHLLDIIHDRIGQAGDKFRSNRISYGTRA